MTNEKLCKRLHKLGVVVSFGNGEIAIGFNVLKDENEKSNTNYVVKHMDQIKTIKLSEWTTAISK
jgi:predicted Zn-dependent protease